MLCYTTIWIYHQPPVNVSVLNSTTLCTIFKRQKKSTEFINQMVYITSSAFHSRHDGWSVGRDLIFGIHKEENLVFVHSWLPFFWREHATQHSRVSSTIGSCDKYFISFSTTCRLLCMLGHATQWCVFAVIASKCSNSTEAPLTRGWIIDYGLDHLWSL